MRIFRITPFLMLITLFLSSCGVKIVPKSNYHNEPKHISKKNYIIDQKTAAFVGQEMIRVKDYWVKEVKENFMLANNPFSITGGIVKISGDPNTKYGIQGETNINGKRLTVLKVPGSPAGAYGLLVERNGSPHNQVINILNNNVVIFYTFSISPSNLKFLQPIKQIVDGERGFINYELVFGGTDGKSITITYREYTANDMARPAFYQNLVYDINQKTIRFRDTVIKVDSVSNEEIIYTVIADGFR
ncbi:hypothetical protein [Nitrospina watsonii]|uniref:hypothetical protein n=1 Tax=Nitrospina watsonii TaxID=1323948 RepID=UPI0024913C4A|nr:hypothetical protein [Nitrospina watsonii]